MRDRRDPERQHPTLGGRRFSDFSLTTRQCADRLGVSPAFIVGEIQDKKLSALVIAGRGKRAIYRISEEELKAYTLRHWSPATSPTERQERADLTEKSPR